jgi:hypothetical protein
MLTIHSFFFIYLAIPERPLLEKLECPQHDLKPLEWVDLLLCNREDPGSTLGAEAGYPKRLFIPFLSFSKERSTINSFANFPSKI